jgi:hypothetical protein
MKGDLPWSVPWARCAITREFYPALAALFGLVQNIFSSLDIVSLHLSKLSSKLDRQSCHLACLLISVSGPSPFRYFTDSFTHVSDLIL